MNNTNTKLQDQHYCTIIIIIIIIIIIVKADHSLTVKATKPKIQWNIQR